MDTPQETDIITFGVVLKWIGYGCLLVIVAVISWIGWGILKYFKNDFAEQIHEIKNAAIQIKSIAVEFKALAEKVDALDKTDVRILNQITELEREQKHIQRDIDEIKRHLKIY